MAVRNESVRLTLEDAGFSTGMAKNAAATLLLDKALDRLEGSQVGASESSDDLGDAVQRTQRATKEYTLETAIAAERSSRLRKALQEQARAALDAEQGITRIGDGARRAGPEIDRFSGRLKALVDAAVILGPAIVPLGAAAIPVLTGSLMGLGAASGAIGASVLAFKGMGDALKAIDAYQIEPTAENLQALRIEMEKLGPAGADFVRYIGSIEDQLKTLQFAAREGLLPGLEEGIDNALQRLPGVRKIIREMAEGVGSLATDAGADLAPGGDWDAFFRYLDTDGKQTLLSFGNAIGDIANGLGDMLVAFAPVTRDFTSGFEAMAQSFADWASGLSASDDFAEFLDYIRVSGPRALDFLGSFARTFADLAAAFAPIGSVVLPVLTSFLDLLGALADSSLGTPFAAALVGITAYTRAMGLATLATSKFTALAAANPFLIAAAVAAVAVTEIQASSDLLATSTDQAQSALDSFDASQMEAQLARVNAALDETAIRMYPDGKGESTFDKFVDGIPVVGQLGEALDQGSALWQKFSGATDEASQSAANLAGNLAVLNGQVGQSQGLAALFGETIGQTGRRMRIASGDAQALTGALAELNGFFDKREAIRNYGASVRELSRSMRNGFTRADVENLDAVGRNIIQVAEKISDPGKRAAFLENARDILDGLAEKGGPRAREEIDRIVRKMEDLGLIDAKPEVAPRTDKADKAFQKTRQQFDIMDTWRANATIDANNDPFFSGLSAARSALNNFNGSVATAYIKVIRSAQPTPTPGTTDQLFGSQDRRRTPQRSAGGMFGRIEGVGPDDTVTNFNGSKGNPFGQVAAVATTAAQSLRNLDAALKRAERSVERERRQRDAIASQMDSIRGGIRSDLTGSLFSVSEQPASVWAAGATPGGVMDPFAALQDRKDRARRMLAAIKTLKRKGVAGAALQEILGEGLEAAEFMAAQSASSLGSFAADYNATAGLVNQAANAGANAAFGTALAGAEARLDKVVAELKRLQQIAKAADKANQDGHKGTQAASGSTFQFATDGRRKARRRING